MDQIFEKNLISTKNAGELSGYTSDYLSRLVRSGKIVGKRIGHSWFIEKDSLENFLDKQKKHKIDYARALARARESEYRENNSLLNNTKKVLSKQVKFSFVSSIGDSMKSQLFATSVALLVVTFGALAARASVFPKIVGSFESVVQQTSYGFTETFGNIPLKISKKINLAKKNVSEISTLTVAHTAILSENLSSSLISEPDLSFMRMAIVYENNYHAQPHLVVTQEKIPQTFSISNYIKTSRAIINNPSLIVSSLARAYAMIGENIYFAIVSSLSSYNSLIEKFGSESLKIASSSRDALTGTPKIISKINLAIGNGIINATHAVIEADVNVAYGIADTAPASANYALATILGTGNFLTNLTERAPRLATAMFLRVTEAPSIIAPAIAKAVFETEYAGASYFVPVTNAISERYLSFIKDTGNVAYEISKGIGYIRLPSIPDVNDAYLSVVGKSALAIENFINTPKFAAVLNSPPMLALGRMGEAGLAAASPALSTGEQIAFTVYKTINNLFSSASQKLAALFAPPPTIVMPSGIPKTNVAITQTSTKNSQLSATNSYTTIVRGVSEEFVNQSIASLKNDVLATISNVTRPIINQTVTNASTIQQVNMIEKLNGLIVTNGDFRGSIFDSGIRVSATDGSFTNFSSTNLDVSSATTTILNAGVSSLATTTVTGDLTNTGDTTISGSLTVGGSAGSGTLSVNGTISGNNFIATSTTATSTFAGSINVDSGGLVYATTTRYFGIGVLSPSYLLEADGAGRFASYLDASYFVATTTTATSTFAGGLAVGTNTFVVDPNASKVGIGTSTPFGENIFTVGTTSPLLSISSNTGYVGIGTSTPSSTFSVAGDAYFTGNLTADGSVGLRLNGSGSGITFYGSGNHDITAAEGTLRIGSNTIIGNIQALDSTVSIGTPSVRFNKIYADEVNATTLVGTLTGGNLIAETFNINSDNTTPDQENSYLAFERGSTIPNAILSWNAATSSRRFEFNQPIYIQDASLSSATSTLFIQGWSGQTSDLFRIASSSDTVNPYLSVTASGNVGIGSTSPSYKLSVSGSGYFDGGTVIASGFTATSSISAPYFTATSASATSTFAGGLAVDTNGLVFDWNTNNVGIGTAAPVTKLHVSAGDLTIDSAQKLRLDGSAIGDTYVYESSGNVISLNAGGSRGAFVISGGLGVDPTDQIWLDGSGDTYLIESSANNVDIVAGGAIGLTVQSDRDVIVPSGNVGIGTTTPDAVLNVYKTSASADQELAIFNGDHATGFEYITIGAKEGDAAGAAIGFNKASKYLKLSVHGDASPLGLTVANDGNVGIGTTSPLSKLAVSGGASIGADYNIAAPTNGLIVEGYVGFGKTSAAVQLDVSGSIRTDLQLQFGDSTSYIQESNGLQIVSGASRDLLFSAGAGGERIRIKNDSGFVGVASTSPWGLLSVNANGITAGAPQFVVGSSTRTDLVVTQSGNVGIGTASPGSKLQISEYNNSAPSLTFGTDSYYSTYGIGAGNYYLRLYGDYGFTFTSGRDALRKEQVRIDENGNVGIGTTSPSYKLSVSGSGYFDGGTVIASGFTATSSISAPYFTATSASATSTFAGGLAVDTNGLVFDWQTNNVGIGTAAPAAKLQVAGDIVLSANASYSSGTARIYKASDMGLTLQAASGSSYDFGVISAAGQHLIMNPTGTNNLALVSSASSGDVGIATTSPLTKLHVDSGNTSGTIRADVNSGVTSQVALWLHDDYASNSYPDWQFRVLNTGLNIVNANAQTPSRLFIDTSGNVGLGTSTPKSFLAVNAPAGLDAFAIGSSTATSFIVDKYGNVGVGTAAPVAKMHLYNASGGGGAFVSGTVLGLENDQNTYISFTTPNSKGQGLIFGDPQSNIVASIVYSHYSDFMYFTTGGGVERMFIDQNGKIGVGADSSPDAMLEVSAGGGAYDLLMLSSNDNTNGDRFIVKNGGNVGIGTTSPYSILSISNSATTAANTPLFTIASTTAGTATSTLLTVLANGNVNVGDFTTNPFIDIQVQNGGTAGMRLFDYSTSYGTELLDSNTDFIIKMRYSSVTGTRAFGINANTKNVSIGQAATSPVARLSVLGDDSLNTTLGLNVSGSTGTGLIVTNAGNVGIGTTSPYAKLAVDGRAVFNQDIRFDYFTATSTTATSTLAGNLNVQGQLQIGAGSAYLNSTGLWLSSGDFSLQKNGGNVGIGSTTPGTLLAIGTTNGLNFSTATSTFSSTGGINLADGCFAIDGVCVGGGGSSSGIWSDLLAPTGNLSLSMGGYTTAFTAGSATGANNVFTFADTASNTGTGYLMNIASASGSTIKPFHVSAAGTEALLVSAAGNVGVGTLLPAAKLDVAGNMIISGSSRYLNFDTTSGASGYGIRDNGGIMEYKSYNGDWTALGSGAGYLSGLTLATSSTDTAHDISIATGKARDITDAVDMVLASALVKQFDATWAVGTNAGGFAAGESLPTSGTIHIWLIKRTDTGVVDVMANNNATTGLSPTLPTGYDYKRRIGSLRTDASANILGFDQHGNTFMFDTPVLDVNTANPGTNAVTATLSVPGGIVVESIIVASFQTDTSNQVYGYVSSLDSSDIAPSGTVFTSGVQINNNTDRKEINSTERIITNTSSQIRYRTSDDYTVKILTLGWEDDRDATGSGSGGGATSNWTLLSGNLYYSSGNVGIGTTSPLSLLSLQGTAGSSNIFTIASSTGANLLTITKDGYLGVGSTTPFALFSLNAPAGTDAFAVGSSTATRFILDKYGNAGVGTSSPLAKLDVYGDLAFSGSSRYLNFGATTTASSVGANGYGFRDNAGTMEFKNLGGTWQSVTTATSGPSFMAHKNGSNQTVAAGTYVKLTWSTEVFDTNNNFASDRFTPTVPGKYIISLQLICDDGTTCYAVIYKNGAQIAQRGDNGYKWPSITEIVDMNGATDYIEAYVYNFGGTTINGTATYTRFSGALIAPVSATAGGWTNNNTSSYLSDLTDTVGIGTSSPLASLDVYGNLIVSGASRYLNFNSVSGGSGYGIRDNAGTMQYKNSAGDWTGIGGVGGASATLPTAYLTGLTLSNNGTDADHDIDIAAGKARDISDAADMTLASAITKRFDAEWAVGTGNGGMAAGESLTASTTIHVWLIKRSDTGVVDVMASNHATSGLSPTLPTGYDYKRRIGSLRTDFASNMLGFDQFGNTFMFDTPILDVNTTNPGTSAVTVGLSVPGGVKVKAILNIDGTSPTNYTALYISSLDNADLAPSYSAAPANILDMTYSGGTQATVFTNTSSQIRYRLGFSDGSTVMAIVTTGYEDTRGADVGAGSGGSASFWTANGSSLYYNLGNVSIGTTTPNWLLTVSGTRPSLALSDYSAGANLKHWLLSSMGGNLYIGTSTDAYATSTTPALTINNSGNLGVATTTPLSKLDVYGNLALSGSSRYLNFGATTTASIGANGYGLREYNGTMQYKNSTGDWTDIGSSLGSSLPMSYLAGLTLSNNGTDAEHDIDIASGEARDATDAADMTLASAITKRFDATWAVGTGNGGFASGESLPTSGTIHIWLIKRSDTGVVDVMANNNATTGLSPTLPTGYDYKRRIGSLRTDASANILGFDQNGNTFMFDTPIQDYYVAGSTTYTAQTIALSTPGGIVTNAIVSAGGFATTGTSLHAIITSLASSDVAPGDGTGFSAGGYGNVESYATAYGANQRALTNTSSQVRYRAIATTAMYMRVITYGWEDTRGADVGGGSSSGSSFFTANGSSIYYNSGWVGLGTTTPLSILQIASTTAVRFTLSDTDAAANQKHWFIESNTGSFSIGTTSDALATNASYRALTINSSGNIGIGTTTPDSLLSLFGNNPQIRLASSNSNGASRVLGLDSAGSIDWYLGQDTEGTAERVVLRSANAGGYTVFETNGTSEVMRLTSGGNVGIGTTTPAWKTQISGTRPSLAISDSSAGANLKHWLFSSMGGNLYVGTSTDSYATSTPAALTILNNGNIGIASTSPSAALSVNGLMYVAGTTGTSTITSNLNVQGQLQIGAGSLFANSTGLWLSSGDMSLQKNGGNVGIGTTSPSQTLAVQGKTYISGNLGVGTSDLSYYRFYVNGSTGSFRVDEGDAFTHDGTVHSYSDERLKNIMGGFNRGLAEILQISPIYYAYKENNPLGLNEGGQSVGIIAQQLQPIIPEAVETSGQGYLTVSTGPVLYAMINAIKELNASTSPLYRGISIDPGISTTSPFMSVDSLGNIGIGINTPNHALEVAGDIGATGFINTSTKNAKTDIIYISKEESSSILEKLKNLQVATYHYKIENQDDPLRLGLIAEDTQQIAPEVLSADGKGVDIYKLATFTLSGVQALAEKIDGYDTKLISLEERVNALESGAISTASGTPISFSTSTLASALESFGVFISKGFAQFGTLIADRFVVATNSEGTSSAGTITILAGNTVAQVNNAYVLPSSKVFVTFTASTTGSWYISDKNIGSFKVILSTPQNEDVSFDYFLIQTEGQTATSTPIINEQQAVSSNPNDKTAPVITLLGDNPIYLSIGGTFIEPGLDIADENQTTITTYVNGIKGEANSDTITTGSQTTYIITYEVIDTAGNSATTRRSVIVGAVSSEQEIAVNSSSTDTIAPVVTLNDSAAMQINVGDIFTDPGATATDETDGTIASIVTGTVDTTTAGLYTLTYTATDAAGNVGTASRVVTVLDSTESIINNTETATSTPSSN